MGEQLAKTFVIGMQSKRNFTHRTQAILDAETLTLHGCEVLTGGRLQFDNPSFMAQVDLSAFNYALKLVEQGAENVHCNFEYTSLVQHAKIIGQRAVKGVVIELVERTDFLIENPTLLSQSRRVLDQVRKRGAAIAMDDIEPSSLERSLVEIIRPDILKTDNRDALYGIRRFTGSRPIVAERIETETQAAMARWLGATHLQGYWCDDLIASRVCA
ncbi:MAG TPA: hypothetical protein GXX56_09375 [Rhodocyclaceae bacterium]|nr:hypothetical protein [Rhodocyclaceae bacterium]